MACMKEVRLHRCRVMLLLPDTHLVGTRISIRQGGVLKGSSRVGVGVETFGSGEVRSRKVGPGEVRPCQVGPGEVRSR